SGVRSGGCFEGTRVGSDGLRRQHGAALELPDALGPADTERDLSRNDRLLAVEGTRADARGAPPPLDGDDGLQGRGEGRRPAHGGRDRLPAAPAVLGRGFAPLPARPTDVAALQPQRPRSAIPADVMANRVSSEPWGLPEARWPAPTGTGW